MKPTICANHNCTPSVSENSIESLRARCPLPVLMRRMGLGQHVRKTCRSPLRPDKKSSWGVFQREGRWFWKDFGTGEAGDEISFLVHAKKLPTSGRFAKALKIWTKIANQAPLAAEQEALPPVEPPQKPNASGFGPGTDAQLNQLARLRKIDARGLLIAHERGLLVFGRLGTHEVYGVRDASGNVLEVRRLDGQPFPDHGELGERKSHALKGSRKSWPVGLADAGDRPMILLVEGLPDFLATFEVVVREEALDRVAPVAMLAAGAAIAADALPLFKGKHVRIVPHADEPGQAAAARWKKQLLEAGALKVDFITVADAADDSSLIKDLNDYLPLYRIDVADGTAEGRLL